MSLLEAKIIHTFLKIGSCFIVVNRYKGEYRIDGNVSDSQFAENTTFIDLTVNNCHSIGAYAFFKCTNLEKIQLSQSIISIGNNTFAYCSKLKSIAFPKKCYKN